MWAKSAVLNRFFPYATIALAALVVWGHTTEFQFVWDDRQFIQDLPSIRSLRNVPEMFYRLDAQSSYPEGFKLFRPLRTVHYALLYWLGGTTEPRPELFHAANLVWHIAAALLLFSVTRKLLIRFDEIPRALDPLAPDKTAFFFSDSNKMSAWWIALAYAVHPVVSEVVCWAKSLDDAMATVFTLAAFRALLKWDERTKTYLAALGWYALAIYSKISAVPFALAVVLIFTLVLRLPLKRACRLSSAFLLLAGIFMAQRHLVIGQSSQTAPISGTYAQTLVDMAPVVPKYIRLMCGLPPFCIDYTYMTGQHAFWSVEVWAGIAIVLALIMTAVLTFPKRKWCIAGLGLSWVGLFLLPVANILPMMQYMAERFLYLPLIGFLWAAAVVARRLMRRQLALPLAAALLVFWGFVAWDRSWIWRDELTLFRQSSQASPVANRVKENAAAAIFNLPHMKAMFTFDKKTRTLRVAGFVPLDRRAAIEQTLLSSRNLLPDDEVIASAVGILYASGGDPARAIPYFRMAVRKRPNDARFWTNLGQACAETKAWSEADTALQRALELAPNDIDTLRAMSRMYWQREAYAQAARVLERLQNLEPGNPDYAQWKRKAEEKVQ